MSYRRELQAAGIPAGVPEATGAKKKRRTTKTTYLAGPAVGAGMRVVTAAQEKQAGVMPACGPAGCAGQPAAAGELAFHKEDMVLAELSKDLVPSRDIVMYPGGIHEGDSSARRQTLAV